MLRFLTPHHRIASVLELTPERLRSLGLESLLLDADCTLKRYRSEECAPGVAEWIDSLRSAGIGLCLISNGLGERIGRFAATVNLPFVAKAMKPLPGGCRRAMQKMGFHRETTAIVGDQVFADIMAGRLAGIVTFLVEPIHPEEEHWFTRLKRPFERWVLKYSPRSAWCSFLTAEREEYAPRLTFGPPDGRIDRARADRAGSRGKTFCDSSLSRRFSL